MIRLLLAELTRLRARRITLVVGLMLAAVVGLFLLGANFAVEPPSASDIATAQREYQEQREQSLQDCRDEGLSEEECADTMPDESDVVPEAIPFADIAPVGVTIGTVLGMLAAYLVGASFIGAEYGTGALANWLTFFPVRLRVLAAKLIAVTLVAAASGAVVLALILGGTALLTTIHGQPVTGVGHLVTMAARAVVLVALAAVLGFCLALLTRHTGAATGIVLGYLLLSAVLPLLFFALPQLSGVTPWLPDKNLTAFLQHGTTYDVFPSGADPYNDEPIERHLSFGRSAAYLVVLLGITVGASGAVFRRRDLN